MKQTRPPARRAAARRLFPALFLFTLFQKGLRPLDEADELARDETEEGEDFGRIRCPVCKWRPERSSLWYCGDCPHPEGLLKGCGAVWNTFETRGRCPGCAHQWRWTSCLSCWSWSRHEEWYEEEPD